MIVTGYSCGTALDLHQLPPLRPGDIVLLLGKGHEGSIIYGTTPVPWDEAAEARRALAELGYGG